MEFIDIVVFIIYALVIIVVGNYRHGSEVREEMTKSTSLKVMHCYGI